MHNSSVPIMLALSLVAGCSDSGACLELDTDGGSGVGSGVLVWEQLFADGTDDVVRDLAVDPCTGRVAVTGRLWTNDYRFTQDIWVAHLAHDGAPSWDLRVNHVFHDRGIALAIADDGSLIVAGISEFGEYPGNALDAGWLARFDADGSERWRLREQFEDHDTRFGGLALDGDRIYLADTRQYSTLRTSAVARAYTLSGERLWLREDQDGSVLRNVFVLDDGEPLFLGERDDSLLLQRLSRDGELRAELLVDIRPSSSAAVLTPEQDLLVGHGTNPGMISKISLDGAPIWSLALGPDEHLSDIDVAADGAIYVGGFDRSNNLAGRPWVAVLEPDGSRRWSTIVAHTGIVFAIAVGPRGDLFAAGRVDATPAAPGEHNDDIWIARFGR